MGWFKDLRSAVGQGLRFGVGVAAFGAANAWTSSLFGYGMAQAQQWLGLPSGAAALGRGCYDPRGAYLAQAQTNARMDRLEYENAMLKYRLCRAGI